MRRVLRVAILLGIAAAILLLAILILLPFAVERMQDDLVRRVATAIGEDVEIESLQMRSIAPWLRVNGLQIGSPARFRAGDASLRIDVRRSLSAGRLVGRAELRDFELDLSRPSPQREEAQPSRTGSLPLPIFLVVEMRTGRVVLPDERRVAVERLDGEVSLGTRGDAELEAAAGGLELRWRDRLTVADSARVAAEWRGEVLSTEVLEVRGPDLTIDASPGAGMDGASPRGIGPTRIQLEGQLRELIEFAAASEVDVGGRASIDLQIEGPFADPLLRGAVNVDEPSFDRVRFETLAADVARSAGVRSADNVEVTWPPGRLAGALRLIESPLRLEGAVRWLDVDINALLSTDGDATAADGETSGDADLAIDLDSLNIRVDARGRIDSGKGAPIPITAILESDGESVSGSAEVAVDPQNHLTIVIAHADASELSGTAAIRVTAIEDVLHALDYRGPLPARGGFAADATLSGTPEAPVAEIEIASSRLTLADGTPAEFRSRLRVSKQEARVDALSLRAAGGELVARGDVAISSGGVNEWDLQLVMVPLHPILETLRRSTGWSAGEIAGGIDGRVSVRGPWSALEAAARLGVEDARVGSIGLGRVELAGDAQGGRWRVDASVSEESRIRAAASVAGSGGGVREIIATIDDWPVEELVDLGDEEFTGRLAGELRLSAADRKANGSARLALRQLRIGDLDLGDSELSGVGDAGVWRIQGTLLDGSMTLVADVREGNGFPFEASLDWRQQSVPAVEVAGEKISVSSRGLLTVKGKLAALADANAELEVDDLQIASGGEVISSATALRARFDDGALRIDAAELRGSATKVSIEGGVGLNRPERLVIDGVVDLESVAPLIPAVEEGAGTLELKLDVRTGAAPIEIEGKAILRDIGLELSGAPPATKVVGEIQFSGGRAHVESLDGEMGGGKFSIRGDVGVDSGPDLRWELAEVGFEPVPDLEMIVSAEGTLAGAWDSPPVLAGTITIDNLLYDRDLGYQDLIPSFDRAMAPPQRIANDRPPLKLDLRVVARDGLYVENNIANLEARTDLRIRGTPRKPSPRGTIEVIDGGISLRGREFDIENGVLTFRRDLPGEAQIDFLAESLIEAEDVPYRVTVRVTGTTDEYQVRLGSEEGLSQTDIAALIAFGKTMAQAREGGDSTPALDRLAGLAGGRMGGFLASEARAVLPFDQIEIRPGYSPSTGQFEPQLRVGKTITADLSAWLGQTFGVQPQTLLEATYALTTQISTVLRWESQTHTQEGAFGGEVSQRFEFWHFPTWLTWGDDGERPGDE